MGTFKKIQSEQTKHREMGAQQDLRAARDLWHRNGVPEIRNGKHKEENKVDNLEISNVRERDK